MSKISVIVPVYNVELYITRCVDSILNQAFDDFELILVDDGSPDNCPTICDKYAKMDSRIHVIHQTNGGLSVARNAGIDWAFNNSNSEWITFIDSDDWVHSNYLDYLYKSACATNTSVSVCSFEETTEFFVENQHKFPTSKVVEPEDFYVENRVNFVIACGKLYKKELFLNIRFPEGMIHEDEFVTYKILFREDKISIIDSQLYYYYQNPLGITKSVWSPKRLHATMAIKEQLAFFVANGFNNAEKVTAKLLINTLANSQILVNKSAIEPKEKHTITNNIAKDLRKYLRKYTRFIPFNNNKYIYELAFPKRMHLYWLCVRLFKRL